MIHARSDYDAIQPWPTKRPHIAKQNGNTVHVPIDDPGWAGTDARVQVKTGRVQPLIPDDEPVFLIRGQDLAAIPAMEAWCEAAQSLGADPEIIEAVQRHIGLVREWQCDHAKVPDAPAGTLSPSPAREREPEERVPCTCKPRGGCIPECPHEDECYAQWMLTRKASHSAPIQEPSNKERGE